MNRKVDGSIWLLILLAAFMIITGGYVLAQTGGGFDLSWSTVDGGGGMFSNGGDFSLGGTIGQPDAGNMNGGSFSVNGGFWQNVCLVPTDITPDIDVNLNQVQLSWLTVSDATSYTIYRAQDTPYFTPTVSYSNTTTLMWDDPDPSSLGDPINNHYYIVRATSDCGQSPDSKRMGEFDYSITSGS